MSGSISFLTRLINRLLPFATPGTPLIQDLLHLAALCSALYFAPQIQAYYQRNIAHRDSNQQQNQAANEPVAVDNTQQQQDPAPQEQPPQPEPQHDHQQEQAAQDVNEAGPADGAPGPANPRPRDIAAREVGKKKAASLARRDQRRAYHEFQRQQGEQQRARDAEGAAEREAELARERERRAQTEAELREREAREREERRAREAEAREREVRRREGAARIVREGLAQRGMVRLAEVQESVGGVDEAWVESIVRASGVLGERDGSITSLTGGGWVVRVSREDMDECYRRLLETDAGEADGKISSKEIGGMLETVIRERAAVSG
ncbi:hypothetical protein MBLNU457_2025t1 [Dothideomycetes sp. NU457]